MYNKHHPLTVKACTGFQLNTTLLIIQHVDHEGPDLIGRLAEEHGLAGQTNREIILKMLTDRTN